jgi:hypothetical protein
MIVVPVAASAYGAMVLRCRVLGGLLGCVLGAALWRVNLLCLGYVVGHRSGSLRRSSFSGRWDGTSYRVLSKMQGALIQDSCDAQVLNDKR